jgi:1-acyl-sn-glycerol-3-phosphate acyltransferase
MGDWYHRIVVLFCRHPFWLSSRPVVLHRDRVPRRGAFLLASNHVSPLDVAVLLRHTPRMLDFVSTTQMFSKPLVAWFFRNMNAFPLDRSRSDPRTVRVILDRLQRGRAVAMFPEGRVRPESESVVHGTPMRPSAARTARMAGAPLLPAVVWGTPVYGRLSSWLPIKRVRYGVAYGDPIPVSDEDDAERQMREAFQSLYREICDALGWAPESSRSDPMPPSAAPSTVAEQMR